jgi:hypothetical protein
MAVAYSTVDDRAFDLLIMYKRGKRNDRHSARRFSQEARHEFAGQ